MKTNLEKQLKEEKFWYWYHLSFMIFDTLLLVLNIIIVSIDWNEYVLSKPQNLFIRGLLIGLLFMAILFFLKEFLDKAREVKNLKTIIEGLDNGSVEIKVETSLEDVVRNGNSKITIEESKQQDDN